MTEKIERLAAENAEMPDNLEMPEQLLFLTLRTLYQNFFSGAINKERAKREKSRIYVAYRGLRADYRIVEEHLTIRKRLTTTIGELYTCGCSNCRQLLNVFVGVDRKDIPQDMKELHQWNERLRDLVQERSERNAELAMVIDRVRWALEKNDIERAKEILAK